jgi:glycogen debranching enzyme
MTTRQGRPGDDEVVELHDRYYILATSSRTDDRTRVLKRGDTFGVFDRFGDIQPVGLGEQGLYDDGTRYLSRLELRLGGRRPMLLSSTVKKENDLLTVDLANPDLVDARGEIVLARGELHIFRTKFLWAGACYERLRISNFGLHPVETELAVSFDADFADIFEVRGAKRERRGRRLTDLVEGGAVMLGYEGLDGVVRRTRLALAPAQIAQGLSGRQARFPLRLGPHEATTLYLTVCCEAADRPARALVSNEEGFAALQAELARSHVTRCQVRSANPDLDEWIARSASDLQMMITETPLGPYPYAGVPWFSCPFGRDGIITALEVLWLAPEIARGVLRFLAATQATETVPAQDAEPGKILHEARGGEMAALGEVPFRRYYGSVDATPLFVVLAEAYWRRTGDGDFLHEIWPNVARALRWIEGLGDADRDGFVEYARKSDKGLVQQGWKDSHDSVFHADGTLAEAPIALCEVQGYVYAAWQAAAELSTALGRSEDAAIYTHKAQVLRARFEQRFWSEELGGYVLALDGHKRPCLVRASNAGHALWAGIASRAHARRAADALMGDTCFSGWGVRTLAAGEARENPMSYHNGSVWPHDNALIAAGFARYGFRSLVLSLFEAMLEASLFLDLRRLPELFCGFPRRTGEGPTLYPVACAPQAWASGAVFMLLEAALGLRIDGRRREICFSHPVLPDSIPELRIVGLPVGNATADLLLENHPHDVGITVLKREGEVRVVVVK